MPVNRRVTAKTHMYVVDDEWALNNETKTSEQTREAIVSDSSPQQLMHMEVRVGGEVRVELDLTAIALDNSDVRVDGKALLFEGTSEGNTDLDGTAPFSVVVPAGRFTSHSVVVKNIDEGGDYADITITLSNQNL